MEQNQLAWVTCHSEATLLGQLCFKNIFLSQNLLFPQMPTLPTLVSWVPAPWVRARTPSAFASPANCPGSSFFSPIFYGTFQIPSQLEKVTLPAEDNPLAWDLPWVRGSSVTIRPSLHKFLPPRPSPSLTSWNSTHPWETFEGLDFFTSSSCFFLVHRRWKP